MHQGILWVVFAAWLYSLSVPAATLKLAAVDVFTIHSGKLAKEAGYLADVSSLIRPGYLSKQCWLELGNGSKGLIVTYLDRDEWLKQNVSLRGEHSAKISNEFTVRVDRAGLRVYLCPPGSPQEVYRCESDFRMDAVSLVSYKGKIVIGGRYFGKKGIVIRIIDAQQYRVVKEVPVLDEYLPEVQAVSWVDEKRVILLYEARHGSSYFEIDTESGRILTVAHDKLLKVDAGAVSLRDPPLNTP